MSEITRFAPSPNGFLHLGHAYSALFAYHAAEGGRFLLRIEDIDLTRARPEFEQAIFEDLSWLGLTWEEPVLRQSTRFALYASALETLEDAGLIYPCFCSRKDIRAALHAPHGPGGSVYPGTCRHLPNEEVERRKVDNTPYALHLDMARATRITGPLSFIEEGNRMEYSEETLIAETGDVVLSRKDVPASYHLAVTLDDALQGVTLITRGQDLAFATPIHRLLQMLLGLPEPRWHHHSIIEDTEGMRLAKRKGSPAIRDLRATGHSPEDVRKMVDY